MPAKKSAFFTMSFELLIESCRSNTIRELLELRLSSGIFNNVATCEIFQRRSKEAIDCQKKLMRQWMITGTTQFFKNETFQRNPKWRLVLQELYFDPEIDVVHKGLLQWVLQTMESGQLSSPPFGETVRYAVADLRIKSWINTYDHAFLRGLLPYAKLRASEVANISSSLLDRELRELFNESCCQFLLQLPVPSRVDEYCSRLIDSIRRNSSDGISLKAILLSRMMSARPDSKETVQALLDPFLALPSSLDVDVRFALLRGLEKQQVKREWLINACCVFLQACDKVTLAYLINRYFAIDKHHALLGDAYRNYLHRVLIKRIAAFGVDETFYFLNLPDKVNDKMIQRTLIASACVILPKIKAFFSQETHQNTELMEMKSRIVALAHILPKIKAPYFKSRMGAIMLDALDQYVPETDTFSQFVFQQIVLSVFSAFSYFDPNQKLRLKQILERKLSADSSQEPAIISTLVEGLMHIVNVHVGKQLGPLVINQLLVLSEFGQSASQRAYIQRFPLWHRIQTAYSLEAIEGAEALIAECLTLVNAYHGESVVYLALEYAEMLYLKHDMQFPEACLRELIQSFADNHPSIREKALHFFMLVLPSLPLEQRESLLAAEITSVEFVFLKEFVSRLQQVDIKKPGCASSVEAAVGELHQNGLFG